MSLRMEPMGTLTVHIGDSWNVADGPIAGRSCSAFTGVDWTGPHLVARSVWGNGSYLNGPEVAEPHIRVFFRTDDDVPFYLDYIARAHLPTHVRGESPVIMAGRLEVPESSDRYRWLNRTQVVGRGQLDTRAKTQTYEMSVLRWDGDSGPSTG